MSNVIGGWATQYILMYLQKSKNYNSDKILLKVDNMSEDYMLKILQSITEKESQIEPYYKPIIKTTSKVAGYEQYQCKENETAVWLRNSISPNEVVILFMTETIEANQSLKEVIAIDEISLLSSLGIEALYEYLKNESLLSPPDISSLQKFIKVYQQVVDTQLTLYVSFIEAILAYKEDTDICIRISEALPKLRLFKMPSLSVDKVVELRRQLQENHNLSQFRKDGRVMLDEEDVKQKLEKFIASEKENGKQFYNVWKVCETEAGLLQDFQDFIEYRNRNLLQLSYDDIKEIFSVKTSNTVKNRMNIARQELLFALDEKLEAMDNIEDKNFEKSEEERRFDEGLEAVNEKTDVEAMESFLTNYQEYLDSKDIKRIEKNITRLKNPARYTNLLEAIMKETTFMLAEAAEEAAEKIVFHISAPKENLTKDDAALVNFHTQLISQLSPIITCDKTTGNKTTRSFPEQLSYTITMSDGTKNTIIATSEFTIDPSQLVESKISFFTFHSNLESKKGSYYARKENNQATDVSIANELNELSRIGEQADINLKNLSDSMKHYVTKFEYIVSATLQGELTLDQYKEFSVETEKILSQSTGDPSNARKVFDCFNRINVLDSYRKEASWMEPVLQKRVVSIFNPMALLAQMTRIIRISNYIVLLTNREERKQLLEIADIESYMAYEFNRMNIIMPKYMIEHKNSNNLLIEREHTYGQSVFTMLSHQYSNSENKQHFSKEVLAVVQDYVKVYPYATDSLSVLFINVTNIDFIKDAVKKLLDTNLIKRLNIVLHAEKDMALHYREMSMWIKENESYAYLANSKLPRLTVTIIPEKRNYNEIQRIEMAMNDYDLAIFMDYFNQGEQQNYHFEAMRLELSELDDMRWVEPEIQNYTACNGGTRYMDYTGHVMPKLLAQYYAMQYMMHEGRAINEADQDYFILKGKISIGATNINRLFSEIHERFNWVMSYDRFLDADLVRQIDKKIAIVKYKLDHTLNGQHNVIISSTESINHGLQNRADYYYYDRISGRVADLLQIKAPNNAKTRDIVDTVKNLSGTLVLKSMGAGRFMHELLSVYFTLNLDAEATTTTNVVIWGMCDDISWFKKRGKRPDLLRTTIEFNKVQHEYTVNLELIELKFISDKSYEAEVADAEKQLIAGENNLRSYFDFPKDVRDKDVRLDSFYRYIREARSYNEMELSILAQLYKGTDAKITFTYTKTIHAYIHSKAVNFVNKEMLETGHYTEKSRENITIHTFTRPYILQQLNVEDDKREIMITAETKSELSYLQAVKVIADEATDLDETEEDTEILEEVVVTENDFTPVIELPIEKENVNLSTTTTNRSVINTGAGPQIAVAERVDLLTSTHTEIKALQHLNIIEKATDTTKVEQQALMYGKVLENRFIQNKVNLNVVERRIGATIIRLICKIPATQSLNSVYKKSKDMTLWLSIDHEPNISINRSGINIDIIRDEPDTIKFSRFMHLVREQISVEKLSEGFIIPIGLDPLNQVMYADLNKAPHLLVAGTTGSGKSVSVNSLVLATMCLYTSKEVEFVFIDPKKVEFSRYVGTEHTNKVITEVEDTVDYLKSLVTLMNDRYKMLGDIGSANLTDYEEYRKNSDSSLPEMPRLIVVFDEYAEFMLREKEHATEIGNAISSLSGMGRAAGVHLIICTQTPKAEVINTTIRNNLAVRLCLKVADRNASNVVLGQPGGEKLSGQGDYLLQIEQKTERGRSPFIESIVMKGLMDYFKK